MNILVTLCGRGGSKGIPGKNIKLLQGRPLICYSLDRAYEFAKNHANVDIALSTDDDRIKAVAGEYGLRTDYTRPNYLADDTTGKIEVLTNVLEYYEAKEHRKYDILLDLDITSPLRTLEDLNKGWEMLVRDKEAINLFSVSKPNKNPYFNVVEASDNGYCKLVRPSDTKSRQTAPKVYDMNASFYFYKRVFFERGLKSAITDKSLFFLMDHICFDLDEPLDLDIMEYLMANNKLEMQL